jgi:hypothetical protein
MDGCQMCLAALRQSGHRRVDEQQQEHSQAEEEVAKAPRDAIPAQPLVPHAAFSSSVRSVSSNRFKNGTK